MIEIILMVVLAKKLANIAGSKGRSRGWAALGPALWIAGEFTGALVLILVGMDGPEMYVGALVGAAFGAVTAYVIVNGLSANELWAADGEIVADGVVGGAYDPGNPYNAPGVNPYQPQHAPAAPAHAQPSTNSPFG